MKRKVLCIFSLLAYLLLFCNVFAPMAQREMTVLADVKEVKKNTNFNTNLPGYASQWGEEEGVYQIVEGAGWNTGSRVKEIDPQYYRIDKDQTGKAMHFILAPGEYDVIVSASRMPQVGDLVESVEVEESPGEKLILYLPEGGGIFKPLQNNFTVLQQGEKGILMDTMGIKTPYFEHRMLQGLSNRIEAKGMRVYSYSDAESFLRYLPLLALMGGLLLAGVILWGGTCLLTQKQYPSVLLWINVGAIGLTLLPMLIVTKAVDLPASLMPSDSILNISHYCSEFSNIFAAMESVGDQSLQSLGVWMAIASVAIFLAAAALSIVLLWLENRRCNREERENA